MRNPKSVSRGRKIQTFIFGVVALTGRIGMNKTDFLAARQYRLELILIGFAMATSGDRKRIIERMEAGDMGSSRTRVCLEGVRDGNAEDVRGAMQAMGVVTDDGETVLDALMRTIKEKGTERHTRSLIADCLAASETTDLEDVEARLEAALCFVRSKP